MQTQKTKPSVAICWHHQLDNEAGPSNEYRKRVQEISWYWTRQLQWQSSLTTIFESSELKALWEAAGASGADFILLVQDGQLVRSGKFISQCLGQLEKSNHVAIAHLIAKEGEYPNINFQCFFADMRRVNLLAVDEAATKNKGPLTPYLKSSQNIHDDYTPHFITPSDVDEKVEEENASNQSYSSVFLSELLKIGGVSNFNESLRENKLHLYPENNPELFWKALQDIEEVDLDKLDPGQKFYLNCHQLEQTREKIFIFNTEFLRPSQTTPKPLAHLYSVAAGFRPYILLESNGFTDKTKVTYFDYSKHALALKKFLWEYWDGKDYYEGCQNFLEEHKLGPHVFHDIGGAGAWSERFEESISLFGDQKGWLAFWSRYKELQHEFLLVNLFESYDSLINSLQESLKINDPESVWIWWSNCFYTEVGVVNLGSSGLKKHFDSFYGDLLAQSDLIFGDGGNHDQVTWVSRLRDMPFFESKS